MLNGNYEHRIAYGWIQNKFFPLESILADDQETPPPSHIPSRSSVIASLLLNPLYYSHISAFSALCPVLQSRFCGGAFCVQPFLRPSFRSLWAPTPPPSSVSHGLLCKAHLPAWFMKASPAWTHTRKQTTSGHISNLAPFAGTMRG